MRVVSSVKDLQQEINITYKPPLGFVPTMGALHEGHISLVKDAVRTCPVVVVSIYVNPTQFNDKNDLTNYPRTPEEDLSLLSGFLRENDLVFIPGDKDIYPEDDKRVFHFGNLDNVMEALHRPGHFNGVAQVVSRLFDIVKPDIAYFGQKDFQQVAVIKELVRQTGNKVTLVTNPIIREKDGLAMSSRNRLLESGIRKNAGIIYATILEASAMLKTHDVPEVIRFVRDTIEEVKGFKLEYFNIVDEKDLIPVNSRSEIKSSKRYFGCIAVKAGKIRLIDNIEIPL